jgi:hypothetical protein
VTTETARADGRIEVGDSIRWYPPAAGQQPEIAHAVCPKGSNGRPALRVVARMRGATCARCGYYMTARELPARCPRPADYLPEGVEPLEDGRCGAMLEEEEEEEEEEGP